MVNQLIKVIGSEADLFAQFLELLEQQQACLLTNDVEGLNRITSIQQTKLAESRELNRRREDLVESIRRENDIDCDLDVARLLELVDRSQADRLIELRDVIGDLHHRIDLARDRNKELLQRSRQYIRKMMNMLSKISDPKVQDKASGSSHSEIVNLAMDRRA